MAKVSESTVQAAARHLRAAATAAEWIDMLAILQLVLGVIGFVACMVVAVGGDEPAVIGAGVALMVGSIVTFAFMRGFAALIWLQVDQVLLADDD